MNVILFAQYSQKILLKENMASDWNAWLSEIADYAGPIAKPVTYAYKYRHFIQKQWIKALVSMKKGTPDVVVTGTSGAGKSLLMSTYHGEANDLDWQESGTSSDVEIKPIAMNEWTQIVHVIPGQGTKERYKALDTFFNQTPSVEGVIHVVDWGYSVYRDPVIRKKMVESGISTIEQLRNFSILKELEEFKKICEYIRVSSMAKRGPKWMVIAVNKIDLYLDRLDEAQSYYHLESDSDFTKVLKDLISQIGADNIKFSIIPVCSTANSFEWNFETARPQTDSVQHQKSYMRKFIDEVSKIAS